MSILTLGNKKEGKEISNQRKKKERKGNFQSKRKKRRGKEIPNQRVGERKKKRKKIPNRRMGESKKGKERKFLIKETRRNVQKGLFDQTISEQYRIVTK